MLWSPCGDMDAPNSGMAQEEIYNLRFGFAVLFKTDIN